MPITITEALAEIKTIGKRIESKATYVLGYLARQDGVKDPLGTDGGSAEVIKRERQAIDDLQTRIIKLRSGISLANDKTEVEINGFTRSISDWLTWRREVAPARKQFLAEMRNRLNSARTQAMKQGVSIIPAGETAAKLTDLVFNIDESDLAKEIEAMEKTLGDLDGQLSLKNATVMIVEG